MSQSQAFLGKLIQKRRITNYKKTINQHEAQLCCEQEQNAFRHGECSPRKSQAYISIVSDNISGSTLKIKR
jgi:hypothetical protein